MTASSGQNCARSAGLAITSSFCSALLFFAIPAAFFFWKEVKDKHTNSNRQQDADRKQKHIQTKTMKTFHSLIAGLRLATSILAWRIAFPLLLLTAGLLLVHPCAGQSGTWVATGSLATGRSDHTATLLPDGKVLVAAGYDNGALASAELYDSATGTWTATGSLATARWDHTSTLLPDGQVLVAGGLINGFLDGTATAELYDPDSGTWTAIGSLATARWDHTATLLPNGKVLVAGGYNGGYLASAELYDPATGTWTATGSLIYGRDRHTATLLPNGNVLVAGGSIFDGLGTAELYDPASGTWAATGFLNHDRDSHTATLLPTGKVIVAGGYGSGGDATASAELYDPASGTWTTTGSLGNARFDHTDTLLADGKVLVAGGTSYSSDPGASSELYTSDGGGELTLASSFSRKTGKYFSFNIPLPGVEDRSDNKRFVIGFTFNNDVTGADSASTSCGTGGSLSVDPADSHTLLVTFSGQTCNQQEVTLTLTNVHDTLGDTLASAETSGCFLIGDVNGDGHVGNGDIGNIQGHLW
jgi:hypothetical protein